MLELLPVGRSVQMKVARGGSFSVPSEINTRQQDPAYLSITSTSLFPGSACTGSAFGRLGYGVLRVFGIVDKVAVDDQRVLLH